MSEKETTQITFDDVILQAKKNKTKWMFEFVNAGKGHGKRLGMELLQKIYPNGELYDFDINVFDTVFLHHLCFETLIPLTRGEIISQINEDIALNDEMEKLKLKTAEAV